MNAPSENYNPGQFPDGNNNQKPLSIDGYKFSAEELRVIKECNNESFYQRSLPLGTAFSLATYYAVKAGYLTTNTRFGPFPKVAAAMFSGYFLGKLSYQQRCAEKIMALPNSQLGEMLRQRRRRGMSESSISLDHGFSAPLGSEPMLPPAAPRQSYLDLDSDRPYVSDYDKHSHDDVTFDVSAIPVPPGGPPATSYDELRRQNREAHDNQRTQPYRPPGGIEEQPTVIRARTPPREPTAYKPKNKYGDEWEQ